MKTININLNPRKRKILNEFIRGLIFFTSIILFIAAFMLPSAILGSKYSDNIAAWAIILFFMLFIIIFGFMCLLLATKFKYELTFNDTERLLNWDKLSLAYKKFWIFQEVFALIFGSFFLISGVILAFYLKDWMAIIVFMSGLSILISVRRQYLDIKEKKEAKVLKRIVRNIFITFLIMLVVSLMVVVMVNFGRYLL